MKGHRQTTLFSRRAALSGGVALSLCPQALWAKPENFEDFGELARVIDGDSVVLKSGLKLRLANIFAPEGRAPLTQESRNALSTLMKGRPLGLAFYGAKRDRYDRALAQVYTLRPDGSPDQWVQSEMIKSGYARVRSYADTAWNIKSLLQIEQEARQAGRGLWQDPFYKLRSAAPNALAQDVDSFQIVEGLVISNAQIRGQTYLNFGSDYKTDFTVSIARKHRKMFEKAGIDLTDLEGARLRVRGWIELYNGPAMWLDHPDAMEFVTADVS